MTGSDVFVVPDGAADPGPALPGDAYSFTFEAVPGERLSFATLFVQSNDFFFVPPAGGIELFDGDTPIEGDITAQISLWDAGTEVDQPLGVGADQAPRQAGPDTGADQDGVVGAVDGGGIRVAISVES